MDSVHATEEWRPIEGWPYEVSSLGRVRRAAPQNNTWIGRVLRPRQNPDGYRIVRIYRDGVHWDAKIAVLVCMAFHGSRPSPQHLTRHLDGTRANDVPGNLAWGTSQDNHDDMKRHGMARSGDGHSCSKLSSADVMAIRSAFREADGMVPRGWKTIMAKRYGVSRGHIWKVLEGHVWR